jgi:hypothetical protein
MQVDAAIYSASVVDIDIDFYLRLSYKITPPVSKNTLSVVNF